MRGGKGKFELDKKFTEGRNINMENKEKETAIQNGQQLKSKQEIIDNIIKILASNNLTITDSKDILHETSKVICKQKVIFPGALAGWINANDYSKSADN